MIYSLLASRYLVNGKTNETLQHQNAAVVKDINEVLQKGIQCSSGDSCPADPETLQFHLRRPIILFRWLFVEI